MVRYIFKMHNPISNSRISGAGEGDRHAEERRLGAAAGGVRAAGGGAEGRPAEEGERGRPRKPGLARKGFVLRSPMTNRLKKIWLAAKIQP